MLSNAIHFRKNGSVRITFTFLQIMVANTNCLPCSELELRSIVRHENQPQTSQIRGAVTWHFSLEELANNTSTKYLCES